MNKPLVHRMRMTAQGWIALVASISFSSSLIWQQPEPWPVFLGLAIMMALVVGIMITPRQLKNIQARWVLPEAAHAGEEVSIGLVLQASTAKPPLSILAPNPEDGQIRFIADLGGLDTTATRVVWVTRFSKRGRHILQHPHLRNEQPFGFIQVDSQVGETAEIIIFPALGTIKQAFNQKLQNWMNEGTIGALGGDDELSHLRDYRHGDPLRKVHWRASAHADHLLVSERTATLTKQITLVIDSHLNEGRQFERLICVAASLTDYFTSHGWDITLASQSWSKPVVGTLTDRMTALAEIEPSHIEDLEECIPTDSPCLVLTKDTTADDLPVNVEWLSLGECEQYVTIPRSVR